MIHKDDLEIKFKYIQNGDNVCKITDETDNYNVYIVKENDWYGIALELENFTIDFVENFENFSIVTKIKNFEGKNHSLIEIISNKSNLYSEFSIICINFLEFIENTENRKCFIEEPSTWFNNWKYLLGNKIQTESNYSLLAELLSINYLIGFNNIVSYDNYGTHDIETENYSYEIKSTIERYTNNIHINGQHQLEKTNNKKLKIIFIRLEKNINGISIKEVIDILKNKEYNVDKIEKSLNNIDTSILNEKYKVLESKIYNVDDDFPKILPSSFKEEKIPNGISQINYTVSLDNISYENINLQ